MRNTKPILILLILALVLTGIVANYKMPGQTLYSYKINIDEPTLTFLHFTSERKSRVGVDTEERRLEEISQLVAAGTVPDAVYSEWLNAFTSAGNAVASRVSSLLNATTLAGYTAAVEEQGILVGFANALQSVSVKDTVTRDKVLAVIDTRVKDHEYLVSSAKEAAHGLYSKQQFLPNLDDQIYDLDLYINQVNTESNAILSKLSKEQIADLQDLQTAVSKSQQEAKNNRGKDFYVDGSLAASDAHALARQIHILVTVFHFSAAAQ